LSLPAPPSSVSALSSERRSSSSAPPSSVAEPMPLRGPVSRSGPGPPSISNVRSAGIENPNDPRSAPSPRSMRTARAGVSQATGYSGPLWEQRPDGNWIA
jgi:hypothetical protein